MTALLLENGADVNHADGSGKTHLYWKVDLGNIVLARQLIENGADVNNYPRAGYGPSTTVMGQAAEKCPTATVEYLLKAGASPTNGSGRKGTPLERARNEEIKELLKRYGA